jgi:hypothetical protein
MRIPHIHKSDVLKAVSIFGGMCVFMGSGHLPSLLVPYKEYIEGIAFVWTAYHAVQMNPISYTKKESE